MIIQEGKASAEVPVSVKISKDLPVFYNPVMKLNRDMSILLLRALGKKRMQISDPLAASGIRSIRFMKELPGGMIKSVSINDYSEKSIRSIKKNLRLNSLLGSRKVSVSRKDANIFLLESKGFDYIDIDPFGSPVPFLDAAIARLSRGGILAVTATDTAALAGTSPGACMRRYGAKPLRNEFMHETAIRILIKKVQDAGAQHEKALAPIFSYAFEHYYRVFFECEKGRQKADGLAGMRGYILYCRKCLARKVAFGIFNDPGCGNCQSGYEYAGPLWTGVLWQPGLAAKMMQCSDSRDKELHSILSAIDVESAMDSVGFYSLSAIAKRYSLKRLPRISEFVSLLEKNGIHAARTNFDGEGIRTEADIPHILEQLSFR